MPPRRIGTRVTPRFEDQGSHNQDGRNQEHSEEKDEDYVEQDDSRAFKSLKPHAFHGSADPVEAGAWLKEMKKSFEILSTDEANKMLRKGNEAYLAYVVDTLKEVPNLQDIPVVNECEDVFPQDFPGLPPDRVIEFDIELAPGTTPVSKAPYRTEAEHAEHLRIDLRILREEHLFSKFSKCAFWRNKVQLLGHVINKEGVLVDPSKIEAVSNWERPTTPTEEGKTQNDNVFGGIDKGFRENGNRSKGNRAEIEKLFEIAIQPELLEKIILCQGKVMNEGRESMTGEEIHTERDDKGIIRYSYGIWVPNVQELKDEILDESHSSRYSIHPGSTKMYRDLKEYYWGPA
ncbi:hypothetical protein AgCh_009748 [Apium graveolens]